MKNYIIGGLIVAVLLVMGADNAGRGTFQGWVTQDNILVIIDSRTGGYKTTKIRANEYKEEMYNAKERHIQNYNYKYHERD